MVQEINLAMHLAVSYIVVDMPEGDCIDNFCALLNRYLANATLQ